MRTGALATALLVLVGVAGAVYVYSSRDNSTTQATAKRPSGGGGRRGMQIEGPAPVTVAKATKRSIPVYREGIGNVQALNAVTVRSQVDGRLMSVEFKDGQDVRMGDVLARIDSTTYQAQYDQAVAKKAQDEANLANARIDMERYLRLAQTNAGPKQQADQQVAVVRQLEAQVKSDQAAIDNAKAVLGYTTITSPLDGRTGLRQVDPGNIIHASDSSGIVSITQIEPIAVLFTLPQRDLDVTMTALNKGAPVTVEIPAADRKTIIASGVLQSIDNQVDVTTGTIKLKAAFPNKDRKLWPGQFVSVRAVVDTLVDAKVVPASAIRRGVSGNFVYVVGNDQKAHVRPVDVTLQEEDVAVVGKGLDFADTVVTQGFARLTDGKDVEISPDGGAGASSGNTGPGAGGIDEAAKGKGGKGQRSGNWRKDKATAGAPGPAGPSPGGTETGSAANSPKPADGTQSSAEPKKKDGRRGQRRREEASTEGGTTGEPAKSATP